jgi:homoserine dehydrogenase
MGCRIRLIARAARLDGTLDMAVEPVLLPSWHLLASVEEEYNAVYMKCDASGDLSLFGKGAGALPAATAVLGDLIDLAQHNSVRWPTPRPIPATAARQRAPRRHYLRATGDLHPGLERRIESLVRRAGLTVQNRARRGEDIRVHLGFMISASSEDAIAEVVDAVRRLARVENCLCLGALE